MLERLEVYNFKSYRGHQVLGPLHPFTCIIGPNGSGKSNSMDAISFVLGVRSSMLRSSVLKDLVYRGPQGEEGEEEEEAEKKAWVKAVYTDKNEKEWIFMRTITTTGSSTYHLNDKPVPYNKYNDTLMQHNILVKAKNFLVFQGDVEAVASQSPKDLSRLIEQISGSLELKEEYEAARVAQEKATENATFNFNKRRGLNSEIKQFKEQKSEAIRFAKLKEKKAAAVIHHLLFQLYHISKMIEAHSEWIEEKNDALGAMRDEVEKREAELKRAKKEQATATKELQKVEREKKKLLKQAEEEEPLLVAAGERVIHSTTKKTKAEKTIKDVKKDLDGKKKAVSEMEKELEETKRNAARHKEASIKASEASGLKLSPRDLEQYQTLRATANAKTAKERQELATVSRNLKEVESELTVASEKLDQVNNQIDNLENDQFQVNEKLEARAEKEKALSARLREKTKQLQELRAEKTRINQLQAEHNEKLADCLAKIEQGRSELQADKHQQRLKQLISDLQRVFPGRVKGRIVDLCKPSARKYDVAVSIALGRHIDSIVVDTEKGGMDCIEYLRTQRSGIATFVPLDTVKVKPINDRFRNPGKGSRLAIDCIQYSPEVARAMEYACGDTLICDNMDIARHVCFEKGQEVKAVTLDGTVIHRAGLITGGAAGLQANSKRWEQGELDELCQHRDSLLSQLRSLAEEQPRPGAEEQLSLEVERLKRDHTASKDELNASQSKLSNIKDELKVLRTTQKSHHQSVASASTKRDKLQSTRDSTQATINEADDEIFDAFCQRIGVSNIQEYEGKTLEALEESEKAQVAFNKHINRLETQLKFERGQLDSLKNRVLTIENSIKKFEKDLTSAEKEKSEIEEKIEGIQAEAEGFDDQLNALNESLEEKSTKVEEAKKSSSKASRNLDKSLKEISGKNDEIEKLSSERYGIYRRCKLEEIDLPLLQGSLEDLPIEEAIRDVIPMEVDGNDDGTQRPLAVQDFGVEVDFTDLDEDEREATGPDAENELLNEVKRLTDEIEKLTPNMKAIDRLEDVQTKLDDAEKEFQEARRVSQEAKEIFNEVKNKRSDLFNKAFNHISGRIDGVYKDLTKGKASPMGGVAYLSLEDSEEPYLHGIKYHAMPPMKRFRDMDQLSGGEKTMAALALLFAIHSYHPSPFFVLDEVDAALDNTNVSRIANYVKRRANEEFQFIVISLKGAFYEKANALVGVTRNLEEGGSMVLTLDLSKYGD
ncbi:cohesin complex subunit psm1 [Atractiella rhizophila]|nr:cohesin complex subunit psm1 [Atractiella rhizophila]